MKLKYCTIAGTHNDVEPKELAVVSKEFPFVEWAFQYRPPSVVKDRLVAAKRLDRYVETLNGYPKALHLCNLGVREFVLGSKELINRAALFGRVQLNFATCETDDKRVINSFAAQVFNNPGLNIIAQFNGDTAYWMKPFKKRMPSNLALLFDDSCGRGLVPTKWPTPQGACCCGYAGGLKPDNIQRHLPKIAEKVGNAETWIDIVTGVRTNNALDLGKVRRVLQQAQPFVKH